MRTYQDKCISAKRLIMEIHNLISMIFKGNETLYASNAEEYWIVDWFGIHPRMFTSKCVVFDWKGGSNADLFVHTDGTVNPTSRLASGGGCIRSREESLWRASVTFMVARMLWRPNVWL